MDILPIDANVCPSQSFATAPDASWGVDDLGRYAQSVDREITEGERLLTTCYWNLGLALELARKQFAYRQWGKFLADRQIDPTRASIARAIYRTFPSVDQVADLSVKRAYQQRVRQKSPRPQSTDQKTPVAAAANPAMTVADQSINLVQFFIDVCRNAEICQFKAESATAKDAALYLSALDEAIGELAKLRTVLSRQAAAC